MRLTRVHYALLALAGAVDAYCWVVFIRWLSR